MLALSDFIAGVLTSVAQVWCGSQRRVMNLFSVVT